MSKIFVLQSDLIFVLGNQDLRTADHAADLYLSGFAPLVVVSGKHGHGTAGSGIKKSTEASILFFMILQ